MCRLLSSFVAPSALPPLLLFSLFLLSVRLPISAALSAPFISLMGIHNLHHIDSLPIGSIVQRADGRRFIVTKNNDGTDSAADEFLQLDDYEENERAKEKESMGTNVGIGKNAEGEGEGSSISLPIIEAPLRVSNPVWSILSHANAVYRKLFLGKNKTKNELQQ